MKLKILLKEAATKMDYAEFVKFFFNELSKYDYEYGGGNCGMFALAFQKIILERTGKFLNIALITNAQTEEELFQEVDIYHVFLWDKETKNGLDETGIIGEQYLLDLAEEQYHNYDPVIFTFDADEEAKVTKIIRINTDHSYSANAYYQFFIKMLRKNGEKKSI